MTTGTDWMDDAACKGHTRLFFPERGESLEPARQICDTCPVKQPCLRYALANSGNGNADVGIWAGTSGRQRQRMRREARQRVGGNPEQVRRFLREMGAA